MEKNHARLKSGGQGNPLQPCHSIHRNAAKATFARVLVTAARDGELAGDRREDGLDLVAEPYQNRNRDHGNKSQNQRVFYERLAFFILFLFARCFHGSHKSG